ncbi:MAG TPA: hypothetical protein VIG80_10775 [Bacillaceae bacterium]
MKPKMRRNDLRERDDIWNAMVHTVCGYDFPTENTVANEAFTVFQYYSELESGGHESLFTWFSEYVQEMGIKEYLQQLTGILEKIGAHEYAAIEKKYGEEMWRLSIALEKGEIVEESFYSLIEKADSEYYSLDDKLAGLLETYFIDIHTALIDVVKD